MAHGAANSIVAKRHLRRDVVFDPSQNLLDPSDSVPGLEHFGRCLIVEQRQGRRQPMNGLLLVAKDGNRVGDYGRDAKKIEAH
jgi:hypothetical protein